MKGREKRFEDINEALKAFLKCQQQQQEEDRPDGSHSITATHLAAYTSPVNSPQNND